MVLAPIACAALPGAAAHAGLFDRCTVSDAVISLPSGPFGLLGAFQSAPAPRVVHPIAAAFGSLKASLERQDRTPERHEETIRILLESGADPNDTSPQLSPTLPLDALAAMPRFEGATRLATLLLERGAVTESETPPSYPLVTAGSFGREDLVPLLLAAHAPAPDTLNRAFLGAASAAHFEVARVLLEAGAKADTPTPLHTPLICDVMSLGHRSLEPLLPLLLAHGANPNAVCQVGTPLTMAQNAALDPAFRLQATQQLLDHGAAVDLPDRNGSTALTLSRPEDHAVVDALLAHGGHVALAGADLAKYQQLNVDLGPVTWSILEHQDYLAAGLIVRDGPSQPGDCGAVVYSAAAGSTLALAELLRRGADPNSRSAGGITALMAAVFHGQTGAMQLLLARRGIDVNETTPVHWDFSIYVEGTHPLRTGARTALMYAAAGGQVEAIQFLLAHGARADQTDAEGHTALDYSRSNPAREALISGTRRN